jgi:hypothetical protein
MSEQFASGTEQIRPGWYVIERPNRDPARVVAGPKGRDAAESHARYITTRSKIMHTPALVYAITNEEYNVEWYSQAEKPRSLRTETDRGDDR